MNDKLVNEKLVNALLQRLEEIKQGEHGPVETMSPKKIMLNVLDVFRNQLVDDRDTLAMMGLRPLSYEEFTTLIRMNDSEEA